MDDDVAILCPYCLSPISADTQMCAACGEDVTRDAAFEMAPDEFADLPQRACPHCRTQMPELAVICASCHERTSTAPRDNSKGARRRLVVIVVIACLLGVAIAAFYPSRQPKVYEARALIAYDETVTEAYRPTVVFWDTQRELMRSAALTGRVVDELGLANDADFLGLEGPLLPAAEAPEGAQQKVRDAIDFRRRDDSAVGELVATGANPEVATQLANAMSQTYLTSRAEQVGSAMRTDARILERADLQNVKVRTPLVRNVAFGLLAGLLLGVAAGRRR